MDYEDVEVGKYISDKKYKKRKKIKKSDHKHSYKKYIGYERSSGHCHLVKVCSICGKMQILKMFFTDRVNGESKLLISGIDRIKEIHPELDVYYLD